MNSITSLKWMVFALWAMIFLVSCNVSRDDAKSGKYVFNPAWEFLIEPDSSVAFSGDLPWETVTLPHTPVIEPLVVNDQWQGICWYRKQFHLGKELAGKKLFLRFDGAMNEAEVWINGKKKIHHLGGYLPFTVDFTEEARPGEANEVIVRLDNRDNPVTGPKPLKILDFNMYGGLYRDIFLIVKNKVFITDPVHEGIAAGGGVFVRIPQADHEKATIEVKTHVRNGDDRTAGFQIVHELWFGGNKKMEETSGQLTLPPGSSEHFSLLLNIGSPALWSPQTPFLYKLITRVVSEGRVLDADTTRIGIKNIAFENNRLMLNGKQIFLRGVNRHQEYPYVGYALSNEAQYRDARKIKEAGFDYVRLSHYPQAPAFMDACDELGLMVVDAILGWQYYSDDPAFHRHIFQTCRDLIRRDRNHACVLAWEVSLNESWMPEFLIDSLTSIAHLEYPGDQCYTAGWQDYGYDIFLQARQHRLHSYIPPVKPYVVSEYGDWEYYAMNAGLDQDVWQNLKQEERSSRQLLSGGEKRMLQQATNIQEAHNDNFNTPAFADGYWVMYDYNRGYADDLESSGIMSINRIPKYSHYFFRSQRDPYDTSALFSSGPMVFIASYWNEDSGTDVRIFSNCDEVELRLNDSLTGRQFPDRDRISGNLAHPPFTFSLGRFVPGTLTATGYIKGKVAATHERITPDEPTALRLRIDESGIKPEAGTNDVIFVYAELIDLNRTVVPVNDHPVHFELEGAGTLISPSQVVTEAGTAAALVKTGTSPGRITVRASAPGIAGASIEI